MSLPALLAMMESARADSEHMERRMKHAGQQQPVDDREAKQAAFLRRKGAAGGH